MQTIDIDLVERFTGQKRVDSVDAAFAEMETAEAAVKDAVANRERLNQRLSSARRRRSRVSLHLAVAVLPKRTSAPSWVVGLSGFGILSFMLGLLLVLVVHASLAVIVVFVLIPFAGLAALPFLFPNDISQLEQTLAMTDAEIQNGERDLSISGGLVRVAQEQYEGAKRIYEGVLRARDYPLNRLLDIDVKNLSQSEFEQFLEQVFRFLGYNVRRLGESADQGVDLFIERAGKVTAVKAKCNDGSVDNSAIQQVHTGMSVYTSRGLVCHQCVVVAARGFTYRAEEAARAVKCILISGEDIPSLIRGEMLL